MKIALEQIKSLSFSPSRPLIISDADEVILHFSDLLEDYLQTQGMYVNFSSYALEGNIKYQDNDVPVERNRFKGLIDDFFHNFVEKQPLVEGASTHLKKLSDFCDIIILTNIPHDYADRRRQILQNQGVSYPLISSSGPKGPIIKAISDMMDDKIIFIDDISQHHTSVAKYVPDSFRIQFIANSHLNSIERKSADCHARCDNWLQIEQAIRKHLDR